MQVKVFEAEDMASGLRQIRRELGPDALILSTRTIKAGKLGLLGKQALEITAAIDQPWQDDKSQLPATSRAQASRIYTNNTTAAAANKKEHPTPPLEKLANPQNTAVQQSAADNPALRQEFDELKDMVKTLAGQISQIGLEKSPHSVSAPSPASNLEQKLRSSIGSNPIDEILLTRGISPETARIIANFTGEHLDAKDLGDHEKIYSFLHETLSDILTVNSPDFKVQGPQRKMALIGPTGVGKTTTLAKIAAKYLSERSNSVAFITIDTYRIAAVEQLKVYGEIMHLPVEVVITPQQLKDALDKHKDKELILIDTAGRSPLDSLAIEEINNFFAPELEIENYLVLSATTRDNELMEIFEQFREISIHSTIFTKIDECTTLGVVLNMQVQNGKPLAYLTNGQRVPEDIVPADKKQLAQLIIPFAGNRT